MFLLEQKRGSDVFFFFVLSGSDLRVELVFMFTLSRIVILSFACIRIVLTHLLVVTIFSALALPEWTKSSFCFSAEHYMKSVQIRSIFRSVFSCIGTEYRKILTSKTSYLDTFHAVEILIIFIIFM